MHLAGDLKRKGWGSRAGEGTYKGKHEGMQNGMIQ